MKAKNYKLPKSEIFKILWVSYSLLMSLVKVVEVLKYGSEEKGSSLCRCSILLGFIMSKKQERLRSELL